MKAKTSGFPVVYDVLYLHALYIKNDVMFLIDMRVKGAAVWSRGIKVMDIKAMALAAALGIGGAGTYGLFWDRNIPSTTIPPAITRAVEQAVKKDGGRSSPEAAEICSLVRKEVPWKEGWRKVIGVENRKGGIDCWVVGPNENGVISVKRVDIPPDALNPPGL